MLKALSKPNAMHKIAQGWLKEPLPTEVAFTY